MNQSIKQTRFFIDVYFSSLHMKIRFPRKKIFWITPWKHRVWKHKKLGESHDSNHRLQEWVVFINSVKDRCYFLSCFYFCPFFYHVRIFVRKERLEYGYLVGGTCSRGSSVLGKVSSPCFCCPLYSGRLNRLDDDIPNSVWQCLPPNAQGILAKPDREKRNACKTTS